MVKYLLFFLCSLNVGLFAYEQDNTLAAKVIVKETAGFYSFADGSIWKVMGLEPRWRTISEWWNNVQIVPDSFVCTVNDFYIGAKVKIIPKHEFSSFNDQCAYNKDALARCSHIIVNTGTNKCVFAVALTPDTSLVEVYNESYKQGYTVGHEQGIRSKNIEAYNQYEKGYQAGYQKAVQDLTEKKEKN